MSKPSIEIFLSGDRGIYLPRAFAEQVKRECLSNVSDEDLETLLKGPDDEGCYWEAWDRVVGNGKLTAPSTGVVYHFDRNEHTDDLLVVPSGMVWSDKEGWEWPAEDDDEDDSSDDDSDDSEAK